MKSSTFSHILITRTDNIGDVVLTLPIAGYLKQLNRNVRIGFLCRGYAAPMVRCCKAIDYVLEAEQMQDPAVELSRLGVDTIIFGKPDRRLAAAARKALIPNRIGTSHRWFHWLYCNRLVHFSRVNSDLHEAQLNFELLRPLGINHIPALDKIPPLYGLVAPPYCHQPHLAPDLFHLVIHPKSNGNGREWPIAHYAKLATLLQRHPNIRLWVTGSKREGQWIAEHVPGLLQMSNVRNVCGKFALDELTAFINAAHGLIASGTGPLHLAAALGQRTLGLFPPIKPIDPARWGALGARAQMLCQPSKCGKCGDQQTCECMAKIRPEDVASIVEEWYEVTFKRSNSAREIEA